MWNFFQKKSHGAKKVQPFHPAKIYIQKNFLVLSGIRTHDNLLAKHASQQRVQLTAQRHESGSKSGPISVRSVV